ncbi:DUF5992 family protein [Sansalvadorimonas sp. 2012CJ34-2]|uniref:DUF5992 family protein n=1 Tax=Parendozoicomonas callyspongiae TaxID=2942213 RepID=A0ABT0PJ18_9GAMM|nr:DUF5992 family protein [Sansalvadorimonas sp. 2012CJ34-2]MCL6270742.1 DUF5992 family protein [Sansalvadorimonas sp. 2012CJ34-2]
MKIFLTSLLLLLISTAHAEYIVTEGEIISVANTSSNQQVFTIWVKNGQGVCGNQSIHFPRNAAASLEIYQRAYTTALAALSAGWKISVYDYNGSSCRNASYIKVVK